METKTADTAIPPEVLAELQEAVDYAAKGVRDPEVARQALERLALLREKIFRQHGLLDIAVPALRELRDNE